MSSKNSNKLNIPEAKAAMNKFKMEAASSVGGQMVKKMCTERTANYTRADRTAIGHEVKVRYIARITV